MAKTKQLGRITVMLSLLAAVAFSAQVLAARGPGAGLGKPGLGKPGGGGHKPGFVVKPGHGVGPGLGMETNAMVLFNAFRALSTGNPYQALNGINIALRRLRYNKPFNTLGLLVNLTKAKNVLFSVNNGPKIKQILCTEYLGTAISILVESKPIVMLTPQEKTVKVLQNLRLVRNYIRVGFTGRSAASLAKSKTILETLMVAYKPFTPIAKALQEIKKAGKAAVNGNIDLVMKQSIVLEHVNYAAAYIKQSRIFNSSNIHGYWGAGF